MRVACSMRRRVADAAPRSSCAALDAAGLRVPGFGHPLHRPLDPRAERILQLADERGVSGRTSRSRGALRGAVASDARQAADVERLAADRRGHARSRLPADAVKAVPILARTASLLAHLAEEQRAPIGFVLAARAEEAIEYARGTDARSNGGPGPSSSPSTTPPTASSSPICSTARLLPAQARRARPGGGLDAIARLPLTEKAELKATRRRRTRSATHLCVRARRDRSHLLDQRHDRRPRHIPLTRATSTTG